jgi:hypothetical protein
VYDDVPTNSFFEAATHWMRRAGLTQGVAPGVYGADRAVTRAEMAVLLWRLAGSPAAPNHVFADEAQIPAWARVATDWMRGAGITVPPAFRPSDTVTRAEMAAFLWRAAGRPA